MRQAYGYLTPRQRRLAWIGFLLLALHAPVSAWLLDDDSWLFSVVIAAMVATVILADEAARQRPSGPDAAD